METHFKTMTKGCSCLTTNNNHHFTLKMKSKMKKSVRSWNLKKAKWRNDTNVLN